MNFFNTLKYLNRKTQGIQGNKNNRVLNAFHTEFLADKDYEPYNMGMWYKFLNDRKVKEVLD